MSDTKILLECIPRRLEVQGRPELSVFPLHIMFYGPDELHTEPHIYTADQPCTRDQSSKPHTQANIAHYEPAFHTFKNVAESSSMTYLNRQNRDWRVEITYYKNDGRYTGRKFRKEDCLQFTTGTDWEGFFFHLTMLGADKEEL